MPSPANRSSDGLGSSDCANQPDGALPGATGVKANAAEGLPEYDAPLGHAVGPMQQVGSTGVYARRFADGMVLVNPTPRPVTVASLPWAQRLPAAQLKSWSEERTVQFPLEIEAHTGLLLTPAGP